jgi:Fe-S-cluster-containing hydrogenase component 2
MLRFDAARCVGCHLCELACSVTHHDVFDPRKAYLTIRSLYLDDGLVLDARLCTGCDACVEVCPTGAVSRRNGGYVVSKDLCTGCGACAEACPQQVVRIADGVAGMCDMCGGACAPQCVVWCRPGALVVSTGAQEAVSQQ